MEIRIDDYHSFCDEEGFISPLIIARVIASSIGPYSFRKLKRICMESSVILMDEEIEKFINSRIEAENPELKQRMFEYSRKENVSVFERAEHTMDVFFLSSKKYDSYTLKYFKHYISILKKKCSILFEIFGSMSKIYLRVMNPTNGCDMDSMNRLESYLEKYDIYMKENGMIYYEDFIRLVSPFLYNVTKLLDIVKRANDLSTYLEFSVSLDAVYRSGLNEQDLYPKEELQTWYDDFYNNDGFIPLSEKQQARQKQKASKAFQYFFNQIQ